MRTLLIPGVMLIGAALILFAPEDAAGQQKFGGKQGKFGGGPFTFNPLEWVSKDPARSFDFMSRGRGFVQVSEGRSEEVKDAMAAYAQRKGITNGQLTRDQFIDFGQDVKSRLDNGTLKSNPITITPRGDGGKDTAAKPKEGNGDSADALNKAADEDFKRRDANGDGFLNKDEMPEALKAELKKWDKNGDNLISKEEYRDYFIARVSGNHTNSEQAAAPNPLIIVIDEEELDRRPTVYRAGKLPKELPPWFGQLDTDGDGQIALWEWRKAGKELEEFKDWDRDGDGFITAEEVLHKLGLGAGSLASAKNDDDGADRPRPQMNRNGPPNMIVIPNVSGADGNSIFIPFNGKRGGDRNGDRNGDKKGGKNGGGYKGKQRPE